MVEYKNADSAEHLEASPVIIVGVILKQACIGQLSYSEPKASQAMQTCKLTVKIENVLRGDGSARVIPVYYLIDLRASEGPPRKGMIGRGGHWRLGDRFVFFPRSDSGVLRTVIDTWDVDTAPVLTGAHAGYRPRTTEPISDQIIDILLDRGEACDEAQWAHAILTSTSVAEGFDLAYTVRKLRQIAATYTP